MVKRISFFGFEMTEKQRFELDDLLREDILDRYNNSEYWDPDIIETFAHEKRLAKE